ncbi:DUF192 domain-containing protein [Streptomyces chryseus]
MGQWVDETGTLTVEVGRGGGGGAAGRVGGGGEAARGPAPLAVPVEIAASRRARTRGLLGRDGIAGAMLLTPASSVHTFGMRFALDVAYLDCDFRVVAVRRMPPGRLGLPRFRARHVLEAEAGALERWGVRRGVRVGVRVAGRGQARLRDAGEARGDRGTAGSRDG